MRTEQAVKYFESKAKVARALGINRSAVTRWGDVVPIKQAWKLERLSKGKLAMRLADYR
jgi:hypothetical protein